RRSRVARDGAVRSRSRWIARYHLSARHVRLHRSVVLERRERSRGDQFESGERWRRELETGRAAVTFRPALGGNKPMFQFHATRGLAIFWIVLLMLLTTAPVAKAQLRLVTVVSGLNAPVGLVTDRDRPYEYVLQQGGVIRILAGDSLHPTPFLDISDLVSCCGEQGLLGLAFPPDYRTSRRFYVNYTDKAGNTVVARFLRSPDDDFLADRNTHFPLRWGGPSGQRFIVQPFANHNGGHLAFGPDGYLYIGMGDGGSANDPQNYAQDLGSLLGKMLRIDVNNASSPYYSIPAGNPFQNEIWAYGLRNPWRFSFDRATGDLF